MRLQERRSPLKCDREMTSTSRSRLVKAPQPGVHDTALLRIESSTMLVELARVAALQQDAWLRQNVRCDGASSNSCC